MPGMVSRPCAAVDGETLDALGEVGPVVDEELGGVTVRELRQHLGQLGVDRRAVVALHEVLDDELPVRLDVVDDPATDGQRIDLVVVEVGHLAEAVDHLLQHGLLEGRRLVGQADPDVAQPFPQVHLLQSVLVPVDVRHLGQIRCGDELSVEIVGPGVVRALEGPGRPCRRPRCRSSRHDGGRR